MLTEISKAPLRAIALASFLGDGYSSLGRATSAKDLMAFGSVLQHTQHNIGESAAVAATMRPPGRTIPSNIFN